MKRSSNTTLIETPIRSIPRPRLVVVATGAHASMSALRGARNLGDEITESFISEAGAGRGLARLAIENGPDVLAAPERLSRLLDAHGTFGAAQKVAAMRKADISPDDVRHAAEVVDQAAKAVASGDTGGRADAIPSDFRRAAEENPVLQCLVPRFYESGSAARAQVLAAAEIVRPLLAPTLTAADLVPAFIESAARQAGAVRGTLVAEALELASQVSPEGKRAVAAAAVASLNAREGLTDPLVLFFPFSLADLLRDPDPLVDALRNDDALAHDLLLPIPITALDQLRPLLESLEESPVTIWASPRARTPDALLELGLESPPLADPAGAHLALWGGSLEHCGIPVAAAAAAVGLRHAMDSRLAPSMGLHGMAEPIFGLHRGAEKVLLGADDGSVSTAGWDEHAGFALADVGINIWWNDGGFKTPLLERTRTTLEGREQIWAARLARVITAHIERESRSLTGMVNDKERELRIARVVERGLGAYRDMPHFSVTAHKRVTATSRTTEVLVDVGVSDATERVQIFTKVSRKEFSVTPD